MRLPVPGPGDVVRLVGRASADDVVRRTDEVVSRAERLVTGTDPKEVDALVTLVDHLPVVALKMENDVIPVLDSLSTVAPDLHDLLDVSRQLNEMLAVLPGLGKVKKKVDGEQAENDEG